MNTRLILLAGLLSAGVARAEKAALSTGHVDVGIGYEEGVWDLHVHDETNDIEYEPGEVVLWVNGGARTAVPEDPAYAFLGAPGSTVWVLTAVQNPTLLFLGVAGEEIEFGAFQGDLVQLSLRRAQGPGEFALYAIDAFGLPVVSLNTRDGLDDADVVAVPVGGHSDYNWAFSKPGRYRLTFEASGTLADGTFVSSGPVAYTFHVVPANSARR